MTVTEFGKYLKEKRIEKSLSTRELAELSGVSQSYISHVESGRKTGVPSPEILNKLWEPLGVTHAELMVKAGHVKYEDWFSNVSEDKSLEAYSELFWPEMLGFPSREAYLEVLLDARNELLHVIKREQTTYNGHQLTDQDRRRILDMLKALFPEYQTKGE